MDLPESLHWSQVCSLLGCGVSPLGESHSTRGTQQRTGRPGWLLAEPSKNGDGSIKNGGMG